MVSNVDEFQCFRSATTIRVFRWTILCRHIIKNNVEGRPWNPTVTSVTPLILGKFIYHPDVPLFYTLIKNVCCNYPIFKHNSCCQRILFIFYRKWIFRHLFIFNKTIIIYINLYSAVYFISYQNKYVYNTRFFLTSVEKSASFFIRSRS
jgi:hypothetical protein